MDSATTTSTTSRGLVLGDHGSITVDPGPASGMRVAATARMSTPSLPPRPSLWLTSPATDEWPLPGPTLLGSVHTYRHRDQVREGNLRVRLRERDYRVVTQWSAHRTQLISVGLE